MPLARLGLFDGDREKLDSVLRSSTQPMLPGSVERRTHDYVRHGTTTLFAALEVASGTVTTACKPRHRGTEYLDSLKQVAPGLPRPGTAPDLR
jgi:hypothetical protein